MPTFDLNQKSQVPIAETQNGFAGLQRAGFMRWVHMAVICVFAAVVIIFAFQNLQSVTMSFLGFSARIPLALLAAGVYALGAVTGGSVLAMLRQSLEGAKRGTPVTP